MILPFDDWLQAGVKLGLSPSQVWATSLRDLMALTTSDAALPRDAFAALCQLYPDGDLNG